MVTSRRQLQVDCPAQANNEIFVLSHPSLSPPIQSWTYSEVVNTMSPTPTDYKYLHKKWWANTRQAESTSQDLKFVLGDWFLRDYLLICAENGGGDLKTWALKYNLPPVLGQICWWKTKQRLQKKKNKEDKYWKL